MGLREGSEQAFLISLEIDILYFESRSLLASLKFLMSCHIYLRAHRNILYSVLYPSLCRQPNSLDNIESIIQENDGKLVVVDFYSNNCAPCEKVSPLYAELSESEEFQDNVVFLKVNVGDQPDIAQKYGITGWPTFVFIKNGQVQTEIVGGKLAEATLYDWVKMLMPKEGDKDNK